MWKQFAQWIQQHVIFDAIPLISTNFVHSPSICFSSFLIRIYCSEIISFRIELFATPTTLTLKSYLSWLYNATPMRTRRRHAKIRACDQPSRFQRYRERSSTWHRTLTMLCCPLLKPRDSHSNAADVRLETMAQRHSYWTVIVFNHFLM